jgi:hypothetical protein
VDRTSQDSGLENPPSAQLMESAGVGCTSPSIAAVTTPASPTAAAGTGSVTMAMITAAKSAK